MRFLSKCLAHDPRFQRLTEVVRSGIDNVYLHGLVRESTGHFLVSLSENLKRPVFVVSENARKARELEAQLREISDGAFEFYPEQEFNFFNADSVISSTKPDRLRVMSRLASGERLIVATTANALVRKITPPRLFRTSRLRLVAGEEIPLADLIAQLFSMMYERVQKVENRGEFSVRGGIIDCFPPRAERAFRIELFDTEIDSIRALDVTTQRSVENLDECVIESAEELQLSNEQRSLIQDRMREDIRRLEKKKSRTDAEQHAIDRYSRILDSLEEGASVNIDLLSGYLDEEDTATIADYLPENALIVFEDLARIVENAENDELHRKETITARLERGDILPGQAHAAYKELSVIARLREFTFLNITQILKRTRYFNPSELLQFRSLELERFDGRWDDLCERLRERLSQNYRILFFGGEKSEAIVSRLRESELQPIRVDEEDEVLPGRISVSNLPYPAGFQYPDSQFLAVTEREVFGRERREKTRKAPKSKRDFIQYQELAYGDYVVHENYGIGKYVGTTGMEVQGVTKDFLEIEYRGQDRLYIPTDEMNLISKYIGAEGNAPHLSALGGSEWQKAKSRAKKAVDKIADDLVELYAKRAKVQGYAFSPDSPWQKEFEDSFPYEETPSQLRSIEEIKLDMESPKPMDRLLCGDVGYGKTEVALRAAFKAVMDGKQVAFLCPTTILTQQHYSTMIERFGNFAMDVEFLSRFKSPAQQREVVRGVKSGAVDVLVGTHRILSKDIRFHDLGLLIIDEEQRFGVRDKEKIKKMKENLDVLTLSATPIPRTLQLSLTGIRDMSILEEPPEERYPITTFVMEFDIGVIADAIRRELDRDGQVYCVYNRVQDIDRVAGVLSEAVPDARIVIAHGQMSTRELENVMETFIEGEADILLSTTIIETGMDIPNVNTMVVLHADRMGLSQLYQLKGRIGRSDRRSYAYFTYEPNKVISEVSEKRLKAIRDFSEFGSGYKIAMRDLELRGAGNLLGESQSGHIESIGYDLYVRMLEEAVARVKGITKQAQLPEVRLDLKVDAFIPEEYIAQTVDKIMMYRRIASIDSEESYNTIVEELIDRYGDIPRSVLNILDIVLIKHRSATLGFSGIQEGPEFIELKYDAFERFPIEMLKMISERYDGPLTFDFEKQPKFKVRVTKNKLEDLKRLLGVMMEVRSEIDETERNEEKKHD